MARSFTSALLLSLLSFGSLLAQTISGTVRNRAGVPASFAVVKLLAARDSSVVTGTTASETGTFRLTAPVATQPYFVQASVVGLAKANSAVFTPTADVALAPLLLRDEPATLATVVVKGRKPPVERQADKTVLNVAAGDPAADATAAGKTAFELLQNAPGVIIDPNDNVQLAGKQGVTVYIDGKPANLSATDLANLLKATPAANVETVELITNPSARFDAQGSAGVINIRFRRDKSLGWNGSATAGYSQSLHYRSNLAGDLNVRTKRWAAFANLGASSNYQRTRLAINRNVGAGSRFRRFEQRGFDTDGVDGYTLRTGLDYAPTPNSTLSATLNANGSRNDFGTTSTTRIKNGSGRLDSSFVNRNVNPGRMARINPALNYRYADTLGNELLLDADYASFRNDNPSTITSDFFTADGRPYAQTGTHFDARTDIRILTLKGDYTKAWQAKNLKLEAGLKSTTVRTDNALLVFTGRGEAVTPDVARTNTFRYAEDVRAAYATLNKSWTKWTVQGGLRAEASHIRGTSADRRGNGGSRPDTSYLNLFPTTFVQYRSGQHHQWQLNYGRRIGRPSYQDMNPFIYQLDPYTSQRGNPYLRPAYTDNLELSYTYKWAATVSLSASRTHDYVGDLTRQQGLTVYQTVANVGRADVLNLSVNTPLPMAKWWNGYVYLGAAYKRFVADLPDGLLNQATLAVNGYMQHTFTLSKRTTLQASGWWQAPQRETIFFNRGLGALNLSVQRTVWQERGRLTVGIDDLLNTMRWAQVVDFGSDPASRQQFDLYRKWESRRVKVQFTYRFGNQNLKKARERSGNSDLDRIREKSGN